MMTTQTTTLNGHAPAPIATPTFTEAPASVTLKISYRGYSDILFTLRDASGVGLLDKLNLVMDRFEKIGITPSAAKTTAAGPVNEAPICEYHGPMKRNNRNNGWFCPKKMGDGTYCKSKVDDK
jgi:hypothetical protein